MTPERFRHLRRVLNRRQPDLTVLMENVHKPHNLSAVVRSCEAVGVSEVHATTPAETLKLFHGSSGGSRRWLTVRPHPSLEEAFSVLKTRGRKIVAAHPGPGAIDYRENDYTTPTAILLGQELDGISSEALERADAQIEIPMQGMTASLNVSVAAALILYEALRQRQRAGLYERSRLPEDLYRKTLFEWAHPKIADLCRRRGVPYPELDEDGEILGEMPR